LTEQPAGIRKAVITAAGLGTRLRPLTRIAAKEMLPLGGLPTAEYIIRELHDVGITDIIFVVSPLKGGIQAYFGNSARDGKVRLSYVNQDEQLGLAHAVLQAEEAVGGEPFILALGDTILFSDRKPIPLARLLNAFVSNSAFASVIVERVPIELCHKYGMVKPITAIQDSVFGIQGSEPALAQYEVQTSCFCEDGTFEIDGLIEKPKLEEAPSDLAIGGRYIFNAEIFDYIRRTPPGALGELQITDAIRLSIEDSRRVWCAYLFEGERRYDIGNIQTYCEAFAAACLRDPELSDCIAKAVSDKQG